MQCLVELGRVLEVDDIDVAVGGAYDAEVVLDVHRINALLTCYCGRRSLLSKIPVFDRLVP